MIFWCAFSTMVLAHKERVVSNLTVQKLQPTVTGVNALIKNKDYVGYSSGAVVHEFLKKMKFDETRFLPFNTGDELDELFVKGSGNGGVAAAFQEVPYLQLFPGNYCSKYLLVGAVYKANGFGFVFLIGSLLVPDVSRALVDSSRSLRLSTHLYERLSSIRKAKARLQEKGMTPSSDRIGESLNMLQKKNISRTEFFMKNVMVKRDEMARNYNEEMKKIQDSAFGQFQRIYKEHESSKTELEAQGEELKLGEQEQRQRRPLSGSEKKMTEMSIREQKKANEDMLRLAAEQERQKELLYEKIIKRKARLDQKQALELHAEHMKGAVEVMTHMTDGVVDSRTNLFIGGRMMQ